MRGRGGVGVWVKELDVVLVTSDDSALWLVAVGAGCFGTVGKV